MNKKTNEQKNLDRMIYVFFYNSAELHTEAKINEKKRKTHHKKMRTDNTYRKKDGRTLKYTSKAELIRKYGDEGQDIRICDF